MSLKSALGLESSKKVRYGMVALGDITQESLMPGVAHTGNSVITALVTGDPVKATEVAKRYDVPADSVYSYEQFPQLLSSGKIDAIYLATPNWRHAEFAVPALEAGIHVLLEKPMDISVAKCQAILDAQRKSAAKLMIAYRLHFEPATLAIVELIRDGKLGTLSGFSSYFSQRIDPANHRATNGTKAGPLYDMGAYPLNAVRNFFEAEPTEVFAIGTMSPESGLPNDFAHTVTVVLRFPDNRSAQFTASYVGDAIDYYSLVGSAATLTGTPAFGFGKAHEYELSVDSRKTTESFKSTDHFGGELKYFSECILTGMDPEPDGEEGLLDVRVLEAAVKSMETNQPVALPPVRRNRRIDIAQVQKLAMVTPPKPINAKQPGQ